MENLITKIEGHGTLHLDWSKKRVQLEVVEGERLFEGILVGRKYDEAPWITSRICGICPIAHNLAALQAVEAALGIVPNQTTVKLRRLMEMAQMMQSHVLHLFFLSLPDYLGIDRGTELAKKNPQLFKAVLALKEISDEIASVTAGRSVHPTTTTPGGFHKIPSKHSLKVLLDKLEKTGPAAKIAAQAATNLTYPQLKVNFDLVSQMNSNNKEYPIYGGQFIQSNKEKNKVLVKDYKRTITEKVKSYSTAKFGEYRNKKMMVGALARLALNASKLKPEAKQIFNKAKIDFQNPFHNNPAQAIEILHFHEEAKDLICKLLQSRLDNSISKPKSSPPLKGIGAVEAPRGGLYHEIHLDENGKIIFANIITPTVQNLTSIELSGQELINQNPKLSKDRVQKLMEMLVRAYDPCITCAVH